jgi:hypothetical protein
MFALLAAWLGLISFVLSAVMLGYRPAFTDITIPIALYGAVLGIGCGGIVLMQKPHPDHVMTSVAAQRTQAVVGIVLSMIAVVIVYGLMGAAQPVVRAEL